MKVSIDTDNYFQYTRTPHSDIPRLALSLPLAIPILSMTYTRDKGALDQQRAIHVYPTLQFLYSHHIQGEYITGIYVCIHLACVCVCVCVCVCNI